jgi:two-component system, cell cycle sensor histidine kinase and response regulator CckA
MAKEKRFRQTAAVLRAVIESPPGMVIFALDAQYRYLAFNENHARTMQRIWGVHISVGLNMLELIGRSDDRTKARVNFDRALAGESFTLIEEYGDTRMDRRVYEDSYGPVRDDGGAIVGLAVYLKDVTEQRRAELELERYRGHLEEVLAQRTQELTVAHAQLMHAQKLESLGALAGGIAQDFNNLLAVILARAELCFRDVAEPSEAHSHVAVIRDTAFEARTLTKQLLGYAGKGKFVVEPLGIDRVVLDLTPLLRASIAQEIRLEFEPGAGTSAIQGDETQLRQVLLNLVTNAAEAIGSVVGRIVIRTGVGEMTETILQGASFSGEPVSGSYVYLEVEDTGAGIPPTDQAKLFDPFFSTKFSGRGLGLAAVLGIVKGHHGTILVDSSPGRGSRFRVLLPALDAGCVPRSTAARSQVLSAREDGCALVVDDEAAVRAATVAILSSIGYLVLEADGGVSAKEIFRARAAEIDLVLLDLAMPDMNGEQTLRELKKIRADIPVVLLTAYAEDEARLCAVRPQLAGFVAKPFAYEELITAVRTAINGQSRALPETKANGATAHG